ncbi:hypothetical protein MKEN_00109100 [Mycena kentingensis (nom. inval.)]|nr:hypothetical protein MKEN_00109100 [Mycena kentingensis (nom. inval.)]
MLFTGTKDTPMAFLRSHGAMSQDLPRAALLVVDISSVGCSRLGEYLKTPGDWMHFLTRRNGLRPLFVLNVIETRKQLYKKAIRPANYPDNQKKVDEQGRVLQQIYHSIFGKFNTDEMCTLFAPEEADSIAGWAAANLVDRLACRFQLSNRDLYRLVVLCGWDADYLVNTYSLTANMLSLSKRQGVLPFYNVAWLSESLALGFIRQRYMCGNDVYPKGAVANVVSHERAYNSGNLSKLQDVQDDFETLTPRKDILAIWKDNLGPNSPRRYTNLEDEGLDLERLEHLDFVQYYQNVAFIPFTLSPQPHASSPPSPSNPDLSTRSTVFLTDTRISVRRNDCLFLPFCVMQTLQSHWLKRNAAKINALSPDKGRNELDVVVAVMVLILRLLPLQRSSRDPDLREKLEAVARETINNQDANVGVSVSVDDVQADAECLLPALRELVQCVPESRTGVCMSALEALFRSSTMYDLAIKINAKHPLPDLQRHGQLLNGSQFPDGRRVPATLPEELAGVTYNELFRKHKLDSDAMALYSIYLEEAGEEVISSKGRLREWATDLADSDDKWASIYDLAEQVRGGTGFGAAEHALLSVWALHRLYLAQKKLDISMWKETIDLYDLHYDPYQLHPLSIFSELSSAATDELALLHELVPDPSVASDAWNAVDSLELEYPDLVRIWRLGDHWITRRRRLRKLFKVYEEQVIEIPFVDWLSKLADGTLTCVGVELGMIRSSAECLNAIGAIDKEVLDKAYERGKIFDIVRSGIDESKLWNWIDVSVFMDTIKSRPSGSAIGSRYARAIVQLLDVDLRFPNQAAHQYILLRDSGFLDVGQELSYACLAALADQLPQSDWLACEIAIDELEKARRSAWSDTNLHVLLHGTPNQRQTALLLLPKFELLDKTLIHAHLTPELRLTKYPFIGVAWFNRTATLYRRWSIVAVSDKEHAAFVLLALADMVRTVPDLQGPYLTAFCHEGIPAALDIFPRLDISYPKLDLIQRALPLLRDHFRQAGPEEFAAGATLSASILLCGDQTWEDVLRRGLPCESSNVSRPFLLEMVALLFVTNLHPNNVQADLSESFLSSIYNPEFSITPWPDLMTERLESARRLWFDACVRLALNILRRSAGLAEENVESFLELLKRSDATLPYEDRTRLKRQHERWLRVVAQQAIGGSWCLPVPVYIGSSVAPTATSSVGPVAVDDVLLESVRLLTAVAGAPFSSPTPDSAVYHQAITNLQNYLVARGILNKNYRSPRLPPTMTRPNLLARFS